MCQFDEKAYERHMGSEAYAEAYGVRSFVIIFIKIVKNNINIKCNNKRPRILLKPINFVVLAK